MEESHVFFFCTLRHHVHEVPNLSISRYDLKQLFIGSEGTLGVITAVSVLCPPRPTSVNVAYLACPSFRSAIETLTLAKANLAEILSAFEFLDQESLDITLRHLPGARNPLPETPRAEEDECFYVVIETSGSDEKHDACKVESFLESLLDSGTILNGVVAQDSSQGSSIWRIREGITEALRHRGMESSQTTDGMQTLFRAWHEWITMLAFR